MKSVISLKAFFAQNYLTKHHFNVSHFNLAFNEIFQYFFLKSCCLNVKGKLCYIELSSDQTGVAGKTLPCDCDFFSLFCKTAFQAI